MVGVDISVERAQLATKDPLEGKCGRLHDRHFGAHLSGRGRDFTADPAPSNDHYPIRFADGGSQPVRVAQIA